MMDFPARGEGYLAIITADHNTLLYTTVGSDTGWFRRKTLSWEAQAFSWLPGGHGWAAADNGQEVRFVRTTDGGRTWEMLPPPVIAGTAAGAPPASTQEASQGAEGAEGGPVVLPPDLSATAKLLPPLSEWQTWTQPGSIIPGLNQVKWVSVPGWGQAAELSRTQGGVDGGGAGLEYTLPLNVRGYSHLYLSLRGIIMEEDGGNIANTNPPWFPEGALQVRVYYTDTNGQKQEWYHGFYITPVSNPDPHFTQENPNEPFIWQSPDLLQILPTPPMRIDKIRVYGFGWNFRSRVIGLNLFGTPR